MSDDVRAYVLQLVENRLMSLRNQNENGGQVERGELELVNRVLDELTKPLKGAA